MSVRPKREGSQTHVGKIIEHTRNNESHGGIGEELKERETGICLQPPESPSETKGNLGFVGQGVRRFRGSGFKVPLEKKRSRGRA
jgi:hypothetical protein